MQVQELRKGLQSIKEMLSAWDSKAARLGDLERLLDLLSQHDELSVAEFCQRIERALSSVEGSVTKKSGASKANSEILEPYLNKLRSDVLNRESLECILEEMKNNKKVRVVELATIANALTGADEKYKSKTAALDAIKWWGHRKLDTERRVEGASGIF